jgi:dTDP-4-dehydrorhamnose 3,5-epimerase
MNIKATRLPGVYLIERERRGDSRGFLSRLFCSKALLAASWTLPVAQINQTLTKHKGTIRGMHFQHAPYAEMKLVSCLEGEIFDVAVDLRQGSPTFLQWHAERLTAENQRSLLIPEGCAHGFQTLTDDCTLVYFHTAPYTPNAEGGLRYDEPAVGITWPIPVSNLSEKDSTHPFLDICFRGVVV